MTGAGGRGGPVHYTHLLRFAGNCCPLQRFGGRILFAGDVSMNIMGLGDPVGFENLEEGRASQRKLAALSFDAAGFGHGKPIVGDASTHFRYKWGEKALV